VADGWQCSHVTKGNSTCTPICGDGRVFAPEVCDDGPEDHLLIQVENCLPDCLGSDPKWRCWGGNATSWTICSPICGDGFKVGFETCDAGLKPGCLADCSTFTPGWNCSGGTPDTKRMFRRGSPQNPKTLIYQTQMCSLPLLETYPNPFIHQGRTKVSRTLLPREELLRLNQVCEFNLSFLNGERDRRVGRRFGFQQRLWQVGNQTDQYSTSKHWRFHTSYSTHHKTHTLMWFVNSHDYLSEL